MSLSPFIRGSQPSGRAQGRVLPTHLPAVPQFLLLPWGRCFQGQELGMGLWWGLAF